MPAILRDSGFLFPSLASAKASLLTRLSILKDMPPTGTDVAVPSGRAAVAAVWGCLKTSTKLFIVCCPSPLLARSLSKLVSKSWINCWAVVSNWSGSETARNCCLASKIKLRILGPTNSLPAVAASNNRLLSSNAISAPVLTGAVLTEGPALIVPNLAPFSNNASNNAE